MGCTAKQPIKSISSTILIKTPNMKYHDNGFITYYKTHIRVQLLNVGKVILDLTIYKDRVCQSALKCLNGKDFNEKYINKNYEEDFLYNLFTSKEIYFKDKKNKILIKVH